MQGAEEKELGSHHMFLATVEAVQVDGRYMTAGGKFELNQAELLAYSHGSIRERPERSWNIWLQHPEEVSGEGR